MIEMCARCRKRLWRTDTTGESGLFSPHRSFTLCEPCFFAEDEMIEERGNNLPDQIELYCSNLRAGPTP